MNRAGPMVAVCLAPTDLRPEVDELTGEVTSDLRRADLPAGEAAALEHALRVAEAWDGWVLAVAVGAAEIDPVLREVSALGVETVRVDWEPEWAPATPGPAPVSGADLAGRPHRLAAALAAAIRERGEPAVVLCGDRSGASGVGAVPAFLARALGVDQALGLVAVDIQPASDGTQRLVVERRLDGGWRERLEVVGPAVLSVEGAGVRLRRAGLTAALNAPGPVVVPAQASGPGSGGEDPLVGGGWEPHVGAPRPYRPRTHPVPPPEGEAHERLLALTGALSTREPPRVVGPLSPGEAAEELLSYLARQGYRGPGPAGT